MQRTGILLMFLPALLVQLFQALPTESPPRSGPAEPVCLTDAEMRKQVEHVEMAPDTMGNHVNLKGIAVFEVWVNRDGQVTFAKSLSGHALAVHCSWPAQIIGDSTPIVSTQQQ